MPSMPGSMCRDCPKRALLGSRYCDDHQVNNQATENMRGQVVPVDITIYEDRTFSFVLKTPPAPVLIRQAAGIEKGASTTGRENVGTITDAQLADIATTKLKDLNTDDLEAAKKQIAGTARSMGITVAG